MNREIIQKTRMCIATYINLYGIVPSVREMAEWTGESFETILKIYAAEGIAITGAAA